MYRQIVVSNTGIYVLLTKLAFCLSFLLLISVKSQGQTTYSIGEIQGTGLESPFVNQEVIIKDAVITFSQNGFYLIQSAAGMEDGNDLTSDAIRVDENTGLSPGTSITIRGTVIEEFSRTILTNTTILDIDDIPLGLPQNVRLDDFFANRDQWTKLDIEPLEWMSVDIEHGRVGAASDFDGNLSVYMTANRPQREPGLLDENINGIPTFDANLESLEVFPLSGILDNDIPVSSTFTGVGFLGEAFDRFYLALQAYDFEKNDPIQNVPPPTTEQFSMASVNLLFFSTGDSDFNIRLIKIGTYILEGIGSPDIIAVQEVANLGTLQMVADFLNNNQSEKTYTAFLEQGNNGTSINNGFLVSQRIHVEQVSQLGDNQSLSLGGALHDRPPLLLEGHLKTTPIIPISVLNLHIRSLSGINGNNANFVRTKRAEQARSIATIIENIWTDNLFVVGDWNAFPFTDGYVDVYNQITGGTSEGALFPINDPADFQLQDPVSNLPRSEQYSFVFDGNTQQLDHMVYSELSDLTLNRIAFYRGNADAPEAWENNAAIPGRSSDHDGLVGIYDVANPWDSEIPIINITDRPSVFHNNPFTYNNIIRFYPDQGDFYELKVYDSIGKLLTVQQSNFVSNDEFWDFDISGFDYSGWYIFTIEGREFFWSNMVAIFNSP